MEFEQDRIQSTEEQLMLFRGLVEFEGEVRAVITNLDSGFGGSSLMASLDMIEDMVNKPGMHEKYQQGYAEALEAIHDYISADPKPTLQAIVDVNDYILPTGEELGNTPSGNKDDLTGHRFESPNTFPQP